MIVATCQHENRKKNVFYQVKAAGLSRQTFVYSGRLKKDRAFSQSHTLYYLIWHHRTQTKQASTVMELQSLLLQRIVCAYRVPFNVINCLAHFSGEERLNSAYGHSDTNPVYGSGYRIPISKLEPYRFIEWNLE